MLLVDAPIDMGAPDVCACDMGAPDMCARDMCARDVCARDNGACDERPFISIRLCKSLFSFIEFLENDSVKIMRKISLNIRSFEKNCSRFVFVLFSKYLLLVDAPIDEDESIKMMRKISC